MTRCKWENGQVAESMADALGKCYCDRCERERKKDGEIQRLKNKLKRKVKSLKGGIS